MVQLHWLWVALVVACGDDRGEPAIDGTFDATDGGAPLLDASLADTVVPASADASLDVAQPDVFVPKPVRFPSAGAREPLLLSAVGLYADIAQKVLSPDLIAYEPKYALWSDGALKARHLRLPAGAQIDSSDPDHWQFPVGTVLFKEFRTLDKRLETRVIARTGSGESDYFFGAFVWREDESDAVLAWDGASDVRGSAHDVPNATQCGTCHNGEAGRVLGVSAVQTAELTLPKMPTETRKEVRLCWHHPE